MYRILIVFVGIISWSLPVNAQMLAGKVVADCAVGYPTNYPVNSQLPIAININGQLCSTATFSGSIGAVTQSGTWTVQPGNTVNTTPWLVDTPRVQHSSANPTVSTSPAYSINDSIGGLITSAVFPSTTNISATLAFISVRFKGPTAKTPSLRIHLWERNPSLSTCTDNAAVVIATASDEYRYYLGTFELTPVVNNVSAQTTFGSVNVAIPLVNRDGVATANIYACVETLSAVTLESTTDMYTLFRARP